MSMAVGQRRYAIPAHRRHSRLLPVTLIGTLVAVGLGFSVYCLWPRWPAPPVGPGTPSLPITVAGTAFNVPPAAIRVPVQRQPGAHERIDLFFLWPSLEPPDPTPQTTVPTKAAPRPRPLAHLRHDRDGARRAPTR